MRGSGGHGHRRRRAAAQVQRDRVGAAAIGHAGADIAGHGSAGRYGDGIRARTRVGAAAGAAVGRGDGEVIRPRCRGRARQSAIRSQAQARRQAAAGDGIAIRGRAAGGADGLAVGDAGRHGRHDRRRDADRWCCHRHRVGARARVWAAARRTVRGAHGKVEDAARRRRARQHASGGIQGQAGRQGAGADGVGVWRATVRGRHALAVCATHGCRRHGAWRNRDGGAADRDRHGGGRRGAHAVGCRVGEAIRSAVTGRRRVGDAGAAGRRRAVRGSGGHGHRRRRAAAQVQGDRVGAAAIGHGGADGTGHGGAGRDGDGIRARPRIGAAAAAAVGRGDGEVIRPRCRGRAGQGAVRGQAQARGQAAASDGIGIGGRAVRRSDALAIGKTDCHCRHDRRRDGDGWRIDRQRISARAIGSQRVRGPHGEIERASRRRRARQTTGAGQAHACRQAASRHRVGVGRRAARRAQGRHRISLGHRRSRHGGRRQHDGGSDRDVVHDGLRHIVLDGEGIGGRAEIRIPVAHGIRLVRILQRAVLRRHQGARQAEGGTSRIGIILVILLPRHHADVARTRAGTGGGSLAGKEG
ncbi:hypothetical protein JALI103349_29215 [Janthinobacterium lividum]